MITVPVEYHVYYEIEGWYVNQHEPDTEDDAHFSKWCMNTLGYYPWIHYSRSGFGELTANFETAEDAAVFRLKWL
jgi:hypothetical protein